MTDNEIIKALKICLTDLDCLKCSYVDYDGDELCSRKMVNDALDLINHQKAEIEALKEAKEKAQATAAGVIKRQDAEIKRLLTRLTRFNEEIAQPYILINTDAELTAEMKEAIKTQKLVTLPDNKATVEFLDKASIRAAAFNEFAEKFLKKVHDNHYLLSDRINSKDYGMFTVGIEQAVNETKEEMAGEG